MGSTNQTFQSNPYADFDVSQWSNPYSLYSGAALPWPSSYSGWPTDAMGNPIQPQPGMTINSSAAAPQQGAAAPAQSQGPPLGSPARAMADAGYGDWSMLDPSLGHSSIPGQVRGQGQNAAPVMNAAPGAAAQQAQPLQVGGPLSAQQYLQLRANPGKVTTPGATVPESASTAGGPGVLQAFLQNWNPAQSGPGSGFQQGFSKALKGMGY